MKWLLRHRLLLACTTLLIGYLIFCGVYTALHPSNNPKPQQTVEEISTAAIYNDVNKARVNNGVGALSQNKQLTKAAEARCADMVSNDYYDHFNPKTGDGWFKTVEPFVPGFLLLNENLNEGAGGSEGPTNQGYVDSWLNSPEHKATMLEPKFTDTGLAICHRPSQPADSKIIVQEFAQMPTSTQPQQQTTVIQQPSTTRCSTTYNPGYNGVILPSSNTVCR